MKSGEKSCVKNQELEEKFEKRKEKKKREKKNDKIKLLAVQRVPYLVRSILLTFSLLFV